MLAALVLAALVLVAGVGARFGRAGEVALGALALLWLYVNSPMEGPVLLVVSAQRGLTGGDLTGLVALGLVVHRELALRRAERRTATGGP
jgi:hypothetical protein